MTVAAEKLHYSTALSRSRSSQWIQGHISPRSGDPYFTQYCPLPQNDKALFLLLERGESASPLRACPSASDCYRGRCTSSGTSSWGVPVISRSCLGSCPDPPSSSVSGIPGMAGSAGLRRALFAPAACMQFFQQWICSYYDQRTTFRPGLRVAYRASRIQQLGYLWPK